MNLELTGRNALVTGASYGLGFGCAKILSEEGARLALVSRKEENISEALKQLAGNSSVIGLAGDLSKREEVEDLVERASAQLGPIDILVVSTGHPPTYPFSEASDELWQAGIDLLLWPVITLVRACLPSMRQRGYGRIILLGSIFGREPESSSVIQSTLRTGLNALSKCVATENAPFGITSNVICPGYFDTPLVHSLAEHYAVRANSGVDAVLDDWKNYSPSKKYGKPDDLGALVAFLSSPRAEFITGTSITIDGGAVRQW